MHPPPSIWHTIKAALIQNRFPAIVLQIFAACILGLYFGMESLRPAFETIGELKASAGILFAILSTALFGGLIPWGVMARRGRIPPGLKVRYFFFYVIYWAVQGAFVDTFYTFQTVWFGSGTDFKTLLYKMLIDQGPWNLLWATPVGLVFYGWKNCGFSWSRFRKLYTPKLIIHSYATIQFSSWMVWIPAVLMIYSLPPDLQVPLFNLVLCFFSLILTFVTRSP
ncbi:hypothetical protein P0Y35_10580 [Kiritimatiellaeota bacterium B1221]|nr:hypothetical protein [Kiritimatiellaeota bacterium B1221]